MCVCVFWGAAKEATTSSSSRSSDCVHMLFGFGILNVRVCACACVCVHLQGSGCVEAPAFVAFNVSHATIIDAIRFASESRCVRVCADAGVRACVCKYVCACVRVYVCVCVYACVH